MGAIPCGCNSTSTIKEYTQNLSVFMLIVICYTIKSVVLAWQNIADITQYSKYTSIQG